MPVGRNESAVLHKDCNWNVISRNIVWISANVQCAYNLYNGVRVPLGIYIYIMVKQFKWEDNLHFFQWKRLTIMLSFIFFLIGKIIAKNSVYKFYTHIHWRHNFVSSIFSRSFFLNYIFCQKKIRPGEFISFWEKRN